MAPPTTLQFRIPTFDRLGAFPGVNDEAAASQIAAKWFSKISVALSNHDIAGVLGQLCPDALWRDTNALTWDIRTFDGAVKINQFLDARLEECNVCSPTWKGFSQYQKPFPDTAWILGHFAFETDVGHCTCVFRLVPSPDNQWRAYTMYTNLDNLKQFPELIGPLRPQVPVPGDEWLSRRQLDMETDFTPTVLIVGAGQSGIILAARLKYLGVETLLVEKDANIGDSWRKRYDSLCLHFPVWFDHMPYIPFPPTWPKYTPGPKFADWLASYANALELNIWTSSTVLGAAKEANGKWKVRILRENNGIERIFYVNHFVIATGLGDGVPRMPEISNESVFEGSIIHSSQYKLPKAYLGKKVLVVGAGNSAHDIASDMARNGIDVTLFQRSSTFIMDLDKGWKYLGGALYNEGGPPVDLADLLSQSIPPLLLEGGMAQRGAKAILLDQRDMIDGLKEVGYRPSLGLLDAGIHLSLKQRGGGHHFDTGAAKHIIQGKIKIKSGTNIKTYERNGVQFEDETSVQADAVIYATGCGDMRGFIRQLCGDDIASMCPPLIGANDEGEINWYRPLPVGGLWYMHGNLSLNRFYSKHVAMYIKADEENLIRSRYAAYNGPDCISLRIKSLEM
ncbi:FAD/NAD-P-binding domain-containing protein [Agrocybe pediades]|nr:FAD/NAD-P-binding domain-containing protein [Agrocybe pediades]